MKRFALLLVSSVLIILLLFAGSCAAVPDSVTEELEQYSSLSGKTDSSSDEYLDFREAIIHSDPLLEDYGQLLLDGITAKLPSPDAVPHNFELNIRGCAANEDLRRIAQGQFAELDLVAPVGDGSIKVFYDDAQSSFYCDGQNMIRAEGFDGSIRLLHGKSLEYCDYEGSDDYNAFGINALSVWEPSQYFPAEKIVSLHSGELLPRELAFPMTDGMVPVADAMTIAENYLNSVFSEFEDSKFTYAVRKIYVRKLTGDMYGYEFVAERIYDGVPIDSTPLYNFEGADFGAEGYYVEKGDSIYVWMIESSQIDYFYCAGRRTVENVTAGFEKIISLNTAISNISSVLTSSAVFKCMSVELLYLNGYYADTHLTQLTEADAARYAEYPRDTRLVWAVLVETPTVKPGTLEYPHDPHYSFFVDATTGEVFGFYDQTAEYIY